MIGAVDLDQLAIAFPAHTRLVERPALFTGQPDAVFNHPFAQRLKGHHEPVMFRQLFRSQRLPEIHIDFFYQRQGTVALRLVNPVVRRLATRFVPDRRRTTQSISLQQPEYLAPRQIQQGRRVVYRQPAITDLRQNFHTIQLALAHHHPSHARSFCLLSS
ncbi:hypothetical protein JHW44_17175 (plasmid) [Paracoccus seriniphilus]|nr:hypothetical protein JHW44_17175 [Paracoccus seriniphilus]